MKYVITTVGLSLFDNFIKKAREKGHTVDFETEYRKLLKEEPHPSKSEFSNYEGFIQDLVEDLALNHESTTAAAEIASIIKIANDNPEEGVVVQLLATDTLLSVQAGKMIAQWFGNYGHKFHKKFQVKFTPKDDYIKCLRVKKTVHCAQDDQEKSSEDPLYYQGMENLLNYLFKIKENDKDLEEGKVLMIKKDFKKKKKNKEYPESEELTIIFNYSGGYKSIIPLMTLAAQLDDSIEMTYLFENEEDLVPMGKLPIQLDTEKARIYHYYLSQDVVKKLDLEGEIFEGMKKLGLVNDKGNVTPLGKFLNTYSTKLADSKAVFGHIFEYKLYEYFIENHYQKDAWSVFPFSELPKVGVTYFKHTNTGEVVQSIPIAEKGKRLYTEYEIDLKLTNRQEEYSLIEAKSFSNYNQVISPKKQSAADKIKLFGNALGQQAKIYVLIIHKFDFETFNHNHLNNVQNIKKTIKQETEVEEVYVFSVDVKIKMEKATINYMDFIKEPIQELTPVI